MPRFVVAALPVFVGCEAAQPPTFEASTNFDLVDVKPFLARIDSELGLGLPIAELVAFTQMTPVETERSRSLAVTFRDTSVPLTYRVFMDDIDAPEQTAPAAATERRCLAAHRGR